MDGFDWYGLEDLKRRAERVLEDARAAAQALTESRRLLATYRASRRAQNAPAADLPSRGRDDSPNV